MTECKWSLTIQERNLPQNSSILYTDSETQQRSTVGYTNQNESSHWGGDMGVVEIECRQQS
jgi:hypothetical protein